jgi:hypothetical protein
MARKRRRSYRQIQPHIFSFLSSIILIWLMRGGKNRWHFAHQSDRQLSQFMKWKSED